MSHSPVILCSGIAVHDIVMRVEQFPQPGTKIRASDYITIGGGCSANAAMAIARLGGQARFSGPLGDNADRASNDILDGLTREHVDHRGAVRVPGAAASVSLIMIDAAGEKMIATRRGKGLSEARHPDPSGAVASIAALLVDNRFPEFVTPLCQAARARGIHVVIDFDKQTALDDPLLAMGTHVIASAEALCTSTGVKNPADALKLFGVQRSGFFAVTDGPNGVYWLDGGDVHHLPAFKVDAVDTLGAGDAFHGAFTLLLAEGRTPVEAMRFAAAAAAIKCTRFGGMTGSPSRAEVEEFLARAG